MSDKNSTDPTAAADVNKDKIWYDANCHCGLVRLRLRCLPLYDPPSSKAPSTDESSTKPDDDKKNLQACLNCNCSICTKNGYLNARIENPSADIVWISGKDQMKRYEFNDAIAAHMFCPTCGSSMAVFCDMGRFPKEFGGGKPHVVVAVNVRMIRDIDIDKLTFRKFNGRTGFGKPYEDGWEGIPSAG